MIPKIILHVGTEKTGSTSIQHMLHNNRSLLGENGILIPETLGHPCHFHLTACALEGHPKHLIRKLLNIEDHEDFIAFRNQTLDNFKKEISEGDYHTIILSDEHINLYLMGEGSLETYKANLDHIGVVSDVLIYLRRQDKFRLSIFSEAVKVGNLSGFELEKPLKQFKIMPPQYNYLAILNHLSSVFTKDRLSPKIFRRDKLRDGSVLSDFIHHLCLQDIELNMDNVISNPSLDGRVIQATIDIMDAIKASGVPHPDAIRQITLSAIQAAFKGSGANVQEPLRAEFLKQFQEINEAVQSNYFPDHTDPIFEPINLDTETNEENYYPNYSLKPDAVLEEAARISRLSPQNN